MKGVLAGRSWALFKNLRMGFSGDALGVCKCPVRIELLHAFNSYLGTLFSNTSAGWKITWNADIKGQDGPQPSAYIHIVLKRS